MGSNYCQLPVIRLLPRRHAGEAQAYFLTMVRLAFKFSAAENLRLSKAAHAVTEPSQAEAVWMTFLPPICRRWSLRESQSSCPDRAATSNTEHTAAWVGGFKNQRHCFCQCQWIFLPFSFGPSAWLLSHSWILLGEPTYRRSKRTCPRDP